MSCQNNSQLISKAASKSGIQNLSSTSAYLLGVTAGAIAGAGVYAKKRAAETGLNTGVSSGIQLFRLGRQAPDKEERQEAFGDAHKSTSAGQGANMPAFLSRPSTAHKDALAVGGVTAVAMIGGLLAARAYQRRRSLRNAGSKSKRERRRSNRPAPRPIPGLSGAGSGPSRPVPRPIPGLSGAGSGPTRPAARPIPGLPGARGGPTRPVQTKLKPASISILNNEGRQEARQGYEVVRQDGAPTGLAITGYAAEEKNKKEAWGVTHLQTGKLVDGPYPNIHQAQELAQKLTPLSWTAPQMPQAKLREARSIVAGHRKSLAGVA